jgi:WhiB family transcriptional regulator, redox-sensing transcriptional regulator
MSVTAVDWERAACRHASHLFFAADDESLRVRKSRETSARAVCGGCPIRQACLEFRLGFREQRDGAIFGGLDGDERAALCHARIKREQRAERAA